MKGRYIKAHIIIIIIITQIDLNNIREINHVRKAITRINFDVLNIIELLCFGIN